jgi:8-oxo-dGTP pyrophosphatase MutT (NUDIX family)
MESQFTATVYIFDDQKVLLIHHRKHNKWLPPGGHLDPNETPPEAARREAREETGLEITFILNENIWIQQPNASSFERPYMCLLEKIPAYRDQPAHRHIDFIYVAKVAGGSVTHNHEETHDIRWFSIEELNQLIQGEEIFLETLQTIHHILKKS